MISVEKSPTSKSASLLPMQSQEEGETPTLSFSELLRGIGNEKDSKEIQNGVLVLALDEEENPQVTKEDKLLHLLKSTTQTDDTKELLSLNPEVTQNLTPAELKTLVKSAKNYLKDKIIASDGFIKEELKSLPKTLKGLIQVANKYGVDLSKITLEEVKTDSKLIVQTDLEVKNGLKNTKQILTTTKTVHNLENDISTQERHFQENSKVDTKSTALFKLQTPKEITTEQFVQAKISTINQLEVKTPKQKADDTLKMLLRGEKSVKKESGFTADFSVATARVIAPQTQKNSINSLESLLRGEKKEDTTALKIDGLNVSKADSFEVKLNEAKQMTKYLSQDVKTAIEDYKSPFTRVKVQLNPQRLGEVDLTIIQRGKNLHINLSSNNVAINTLALNANDLRAQLSNNGINNATLNFNNNSQSSEQGFSGQQQHSEHRKEAKEEYGFFENEEKNEEILNSLEIVVPNYA